MSETDSFVDEVSEELRRDRLFALFRRWGPYVIALLVVIVGLSAWNEYQKAEERAAREARGDALRAALLVQDPAARVEALAKLREGEETPGEMLRLAHAMSLIQAGEDQSAITELRALSADTAAGVVYRDAATLRLMSLDTALSSEERLAMIDGMVGPDAPFRLLALEARAVIRIEAEELDKAKEDLRTILTDPAGLAGLKARASQLFRAIGGDPSTLQAPA